MPQLLDANPFGETNPCFGCGQTHPFGFRLRFVREGDEIVTHFMPEERYQGPPGIMHGGLVSTLCDEIAAWAVVGIKQKFGFTGALEVKLRRPVRIGVELEGRSKIVRDAGRLVVVEVTLRQAGEIAATGEVTFALVDRSGAERMLGGPLPPEWEKFCR